MSAAPETGADPALPSLGALFVAFSLVGVMSIGGALPVIYRDLVERRRWLTPAEFTEILSLCQVLPGPNIVNIAVVYGMRTHGWPGTFVAVAGFLTLPILFAILLGAGYASVAEMDRVREIFATIGAAAAGLVAAVALKLFWPERRDPLVLGIGALCVLLLVALGQPLALVILSLGPLGIAATAWTRRGDGE